MKDMQLNPLNSNQRRLLQVGVALLLAVFLVSWFFSMKKPVEEAKLTNNTVYIEDSILYAFDDSYSLAQYPNRVSMHYPYLLVILPGEQVTHIYNLPAKRKVKELNYSLLDFVDGSILRNDGKTTYLNDKDIGVLCEKGFIKSEQEVLCLTKVNPNTVENKLISIDLSTNRQTDIYVSEDIITDFSVISNTVYMGEIDLYNKQNYLIVGEDKIEVPGVVSLIYEMGGNPYFATYKGELSEEEVYYQINDDKINQTEKAKIFLFQ